ncbi:MAG: hypothetical protein RL481_1798 [Pseudomonadota bacterium]|jgi:hypothetical protein
MEAMPMDPATYVIIGTFMLASIALVALASLRGWRQWIELKRAELEAARPYAEAAPPSTASRIEVADLKERVKKLEAIAAGIDL